MKIKTIVSTITVAASLAFMVNPASAEGQLRGAMTAVNNVASAISATNNSESFKWGKKSGSVNQAVNNTQRNDSAGFRWAGKESSSSSVNLSDSVSAIKQSGSRWILRNDVEQAGSRWILRSDAEQAGSRWILRNDVEQAGSRWILRNDLEQSGSRWILR